MLCSNKSQTISAAAPHRPQNALTINLMVLMSVLFLFITIAKKKQQHGCFNAFFSSTKINMKLWHIFHKHNSQHWRTDWHRFVHSCGPQWKRNIFISIFMLHSKCIQTESPAIVVSVKAISWQTISLQLSSSSFFFKIKIYKIEMEMGINIALVPQPR